LRGCGGTSRLKYIQYSLAMATDDDDSSNDLRFLCHREDWRAVQQRLETESLGELWDELFYGKGEALWNALEWNAPVWLIDHICEVMDMDPEGRGVRILNMMCMSHEKCEIAKERLRKASTLQQAIDMVFYSGRDGWTCLHHLLDSHNPSLELVEMISDIAEQDPQGRNIWEMKTSDAAFGRMPLHCAAEGTNNLEVVRLAILKFPQALMCVDVGGWLPIDLSYKENERKRSNHLRIYRLIESETYRVNLPLLNQRMIKFCYRSLGRRGVHSPNDWHIRRLSRDTQFVYKVLNYFVETENDTLVEHIISYVGSNQRGVENQLLQPDTHPSDGPLTNGELCCFGAVACAVFCFCVTALGIGRPFDGVMSPWAVAEGRDCMEEEEKTMAQKLARLEKMLDFAIALGRENLSEVDSPMSIAEYLME